MSFFQNDNELSFQKLASYYLNELTVEETATVSRWINESEENARQYKAVEQLMQHNDQIAQDLDIDVEAAWIRFNQKKGELRSTSNAKVVSMKRYWFAAAVVLGILIGGWALLKSSDMFINDEWIARSNFDSLELPDGTWVISQHKSTLRYKKEFNEGNREVELKGNAFFKVHRDTSLPFSVTFDEGKVTVLGTQFYIDQEKSGFTVKVTEGKVRAELLDGKGEVVLTRGKMASFNKETKSFTVESFANADMLRYNNETLHNILKDILLAKGISTRAEESLATMKLTADFSQTSINDIIQALELLTQGRITKTGNDQYDLTRD